MQNCNSKKSLFQPLALELKYQEIHIFYKHRPCKHNEPENGENCYVLYIIIL